MTPFGYDTIAIVLVAQSSSTWAVNRMRGMRGWGWKIPTAVYFAIGLLCLVLDAQVMTLIPHILLKLHLMQPPH